jgi:hypothetical protein
MAPTDTFGSVPLQASQVAAQFLRFNADLAYLPFLSRQYIPIADFVYTGKHSSLYRQGNKYTYTWNNESATN